MELTADPIVCQREDDIPSEVRTLRRYVHRYMILQRVWNVFAFLLVCLAGALCTPVTVLAIQTQWPLFGRLFEALGWFIVLMASLSVAHLIWRGTGPSRVEAYYRSRLVLVEIEPSGKPIGNFTRGEIFRILKELSNRMGFLVDPGLYSARVLFP